MCTGSGNQLINCNIKDNRIATKTPPRTCRSVQFHTFFHTPALCHIPLKRFRRLPWHRCHHWNPFSRRANIYLRCWGMHCVQCETEAYNCCESFFISVVGSCSFLVVYSCAPLVYLYTWEEIIHTRYPTFSFHKTQRAPVW